MTSLPNLSPMGQSACRSPSRNPERADADDSAPPRRFRGYGNGTSIALYTSVETILVPVDFSAASRRAFARGLKLGAVRIVLLHVLETGSVAHAAIDRMRRRAERELTRLEKAARNRAEVELVIVRGMPFVEIVKAAEDYDVDAIVIGRYGRRGRLEKFLFGTTAEKVLRFAPCAVLVVP